MANTQAPHVTSTADSLPTLLSVEGLAEHLGVTVRHVRQLVAERRIPYIKWGHLVRFDPVDVSAWLQQQRVTAIPPACRSRY
jgi:excisionase family DNA binding protein